jgi:hypothetical protein
MNEGSKLSYSSNGTGVSLTTKYGNINFTTEEFSYYQNLYRVIDCNNEGLISLFNIHLYILLIRSNVSQIVLEKALEIILSSSLSTSPRSSFTLNSSNTPYVLVPNIFKPSPPLNEGFRPSVDLVGETLQQSSSVKASSSNAHSQSSGKKKKDKNGKLNKSQQLETSSLLTSSSSAPLTHSSEDVSPFAVSFLNSAQPTTVNFIDISNNISRPSNNGSSSSTDSRLNFYQWLALCKLIAFYQENHQIPSEKIFKNLHTADNSNGHVVDEGIVDHHLRHRQNPSSSLFPHQRSVVASSFSSNEVSNFVDFALGSVPFSSFVSSSRFHPEGRHHHHQKEFDLGSFYLLFDVKIAGYQSYGEESNNQHTKYRLISHYQLINDSPLIMENGKLSIFNEKSLGNDKIHEEVTSEIQHLNRRKASSSKIKEHDDVLHSLTLNGMSGETKKKDRSDSITSSGSSTSSAASASASSPTNNTILGDHLDSQVVIVERRYTEFEIFSHILHKCYKSFILPPLPLKTWSFSLSSLGLPHTSSSKDEMLLNQRKIEFQMFLDDLTSHPSLNKCIELEIFLTASVNGFKSFIEVYNHIENGHYLLSSVSSSSSAGASSSSSFYPSSTSSSTKDGYNSSYNNSNVTSENSNKSDYSSSAPTGAVGKFLSDSTTAITNGASSLINTAKSFDLVQNLWGNLSKKVNNLSTMNPFNNGSNGMLGSHSHHHSMSPALSHLLHNSPEDLLLFDKTRHFLECVKNTRKAFEKLLNAEEGRIHEINKLSQCFKSVSEFVFFFFVSFFVLTLPVFLLIFLDK